MGVDPGWQEISPFLISPPLVCMSQTADQQQSNIASIYILIRIRLDVPQMSENNDICYILGQTINLSKTQCPMQRKITCIPPKLLRTKHFWIPLSSMDTSYWCRKCENDNNLICIWILLCKLDSIQLYRIQTVTTNNVAQGSNSKIEMCVYFQF